MEKANDGMTDKLAPDIEHEHEVEAVVAGDDVLFCTVHPDVETSLRCNKCGRPMCIKCAVKTPVGYRCRECVRGQQDVFFTATTWDYVIAGSSSLVISLVAGYIANVLPVIFMVLLGFVVGGFIPQVVLRLTGRRRGRYTGYVVVAGIFAGVLASIWDLFQVLLLGAPLGLVLQAMIWPGIFAAVMASVAYSWFRTRAI